MHTEKLQMLFHNLFQRLVIVGAGRPVLRAAEVSDADVVQSPVRQRYRQLVQIQPGQSFESQSPVQD